MVKHCTKISAVIFILFLNYPLKTLSQDKVKNIVVFFSNSPNLIAFQNILEGFKSSFSRNNSEPVNLVVEYLDIGRLENEDHARYIINLYNKKFKEIKIDLFVTVGPGLNSLLLKYGEEVLKTVPIINIDLDLPGRISLQSLNVKNGVEIVLKFKIASTLKEVFELFPDHKNVFVISGTSATDFYFMSLLKKGKNEFEPAYNFKFISDLSIDSTIRFVRKIPLNSIVIVPAYLLDANNIPFSTSEALSLIAKNCPAPVFPISDVSGKGDAGIGGYVFSYTNLGRETGRIALEIFNGKQIRDISVNETAFYHHIYNWQELKKWHLLNSNVIQKDSIFYNKDTSFFMLYKWYIFGLIIFLFSQTFLILYLIRLNIRQKNMTKQMLKTENMHRELIRGDRLAKMTELTASLSHELNQPLTAILFSAQAGKRFLLSDKLDSKQAEELFDNIIEDDKRAGEIISSVKSLMKLETRNKEKVNLNLLIQEIVNIIRGEAIRNRIKLSLDCTDHHVSVLADKIQLQQVLMNFISNAVIAMENNQPENKNLNIIMVSGKNIVTVSVLDSGPGIDNEIKQKLFKPFVTSTKKGFGIGLALSKSIIEKHNGEIWAENHPSGGAKFSFRLHTVKND